MCHVRYKNRQSCPFRKQRTTTASNKYSLVPFQFFTSRSHKCDQLWKGGARSPKIMKLVRRTLRMAPNLPRAYRRIHTNMSSACPGVPAPVTGRARTAAVRRPIAADGRCSCRASGAPARPWGARARRWGPTPEPSRTPGDHSIIVSTSIVYLFNSDARMTFPVLPALCNPKIVTSAAFQRKPSRCENTFIGLNNSLLA